jgi:uncharacterized protein (TIGR03067 family)
VAAQGFAAAPFAFPMGAEAGGAAALEAMPFFEPVPSSRLGSLSYRARLLVIVAAFCLVLLLLVAGILLLVRMGSGTSGKNAAPNDPQKAAAKPPSCKLLPLADLTLTAGETRDLDIHVERTNCPDPITLSVEGLPLHVKSPSVVLPADGTKTQLRFTAAPDTPEGKQSVRVVGKLGDVKIETPLQLVLKNPTEVNELTGTWQRIAVESFGKRTPVDAQRKFRATFKGGKMKEHDEFGDLPGDTTYRLDPTRTPKQIDLTFASGLNKGMMIPGIYLLEGDQLTICLAPMNGLRPTSFATQFTTNTVYVLRRHKE